jgi:hypothetical protein
MAARKNKIRHDENTRAKIKAAQIINRLHGHIMGKVELDSAQVSSAKTLLSKVLPDLKAKEEYGRDEDGNPVFKTIYEAKPD